MTVAVFFGSSIAIPTSGPVTKTFTDERVRSPTGTAGQQPAGVFASGTQPGALGVQQVRIRSIDSIDNSFRPNGWVLGTGAPGVFGFIEFVSAVTNLRVEGTIEWDEYQIV